jgi:hypothetical protein
MPTNSVGSTEGDGRMDRDGTRLTTAVRVAFAVALTAVIAMLAAACVPASGPLGRRPAPTGPAERSIVFPVGREVAFSDTFGAPRGGGTRSHEGQDLMAPKMTPLVAAADGRVSWMRWDNAGNAGNMLVLTDDAGWEYWYIHINNDTPGTDDGRNTYDEAFADGIKRGQRVRAGEVIAWVGDSGNAENSGSHLHFEMHDPSDRVVNPFNSLAHARLHVRGASEHAADAAFGNLDSVVRSGAGVNLSGWGIDRHRDDPIEVSVHVDGNPLASGGADASRPDVGAAHPGRGDGHGFVFAGVPAAPGSEVCVVLHSIDGGGNVRLPCVTAPA